MDVDGYYRQRGLENLKAMVSLANEGLKALLLINGGAIVALLVGADRILTTRAD